MDRTITRRRRTALVVALTALALSACSNPDPVPPPAQTAEAQVSAETPSPTPEPAETPEQEPVPDDGIARFEFTDSRGVQWELITTFEWAGDWRADPYGDTVRDYNASLMVTNMSDQDGNFEDIAKEGQVVFGPVYSYDPSDFSQCDGDSSDRATNIMVPSGGHSEFTGNCMFRTGVNTEEFTAANPRGISALEPGVPVIVFKSGTVIAPGLEGTGADPVTFMQSVTWVSDIAAFVPGATVTEGTCHESLNLRQLYYAQSALPGCTALLDQ